MIKRTCFVFLLPLVFNNIFAASPPDTARSVPSGFTNGPDIVAGNMADLEQFGAVGTQRGLATGLTSCNAGNQFVGYFEIPGTDHPVVAQNLYRMGGGSSNNERFEQIGQSWVKHTFGAKQANSCNFGCQPGGDFTHLGVGCSDTYFSSQSADQSQLGSRAWINPFTGVYPSNSRDHTGHAHTAVSHMMTVETADLNPTMNPGATYYAELVYATPDEYTWCQSHPGECNMSNNASYLQYSVSGTTDFTFSQVGSPFRMIPAVNAWTGATIQTIEPEPGVDGRAFLAYKVTGPVGGLYHYEYAIYNLNLDRGIQSFSVPRMLIPGAGEGTGPDQNIGFHGPPQQPGFPNDGTQGDAGYSAAEWTFTAGAMSLNWNSETFAQNPNANAIRWGTLYNFRFDSVSAPVTGNATIGFFKTGAPITVAVMGPAPFGGPSPTPCPSCTPTPTPTISPTPTPTPPITATPSPTPSGTPEVTPTPGVTHALNLSTRLLVGTGSDVGIAGFIITGTGPRDILLRGIGPSLGGVGVSNALVDPVLELHGPSGFTTIINDNWRDPCVPCLNQCDLIGSGIAPTDDLEAAICVILDPGTYTVILRGNNNGTGVGLVEIYDLTPNTDSKLANISTRAFVGTGSDIMIAGFILGGGNGSDPVFIRALGPSLPVPNPLPHPHLELRDSSGVVIASGGDCTSQPLCFPPPNPVEPCINATLSPGGYTTTLSGVNNETGIALVEVYDNPTCGPTPTPTPGGGTPTPTIPPPTPTPSEPCTENFDGVTAPALPPGWTASNPIPGDGVMWVTSTVAPDSAPNDAFIPDQDGISDKALDRQNVIINTTNPMMTFRNNYNTEMSSGMFFDGGALEISSPNISNGDFLAFTDSRIGASCLSGCPNCNVSGGASGPTPEFSAWCGNSGGYIDTVINLGPNLVGQAVTLRWHFHSDEAVDAPGWRIDNLSISGASCP